MGDRLKPGHASQGVNTIRVIRAICDRCASGGSELRDALGCGDRPLVGHHL